MGRLGIFPRNCSLHLKELNKHAEPDGCLVMKTAPLPAGAQFLNVIESVFSGMARAIIHNTDYPSVEAAKEAIDVYFSERNAHFSASSAESVGDLAGFSESIG